MEGSARRHLGQAGAIGAALGLTVPGLGLAVSGAEPASGLAAALYGLAIVGAAFLLAWAAEAAQVDVSRGAALALVALIAVLPEYAVDFVFTWKAGAHPDEHAHLALANLTGGNRLLIGVGWSMVVLLGAWRLRRRDDRRAGAATGSGTGPDGVLRLDRAHSIGVGFLLVVTAYALTLPLRHTLSLLDSVVFVALLAAYVVRLSGAPAEEPELAGPSRLVGELARVPRRLAVIVMFVVAAAVILACAEGFAESLVETGSQLGISEFLLVQWLAPLASEAPELLVAGLFAWRLAGDAGLGTLVSSQVNQWALLVGTLPIVFAISSGSLHGLPLDRVQREEVFLTAAQSAFAVGLIVRRSLRVSDGVALLSLFVVQLVLGGVLDPEARGVSRVVMGLLYLGLAAVLLVRRRAAVPGLLRDAFRTPTADLVGNEVPAA